VCEILIGTVVCSLDANNDGTLSEAELGELIQMIYMVPTLTLRGPSLSTAWSTIITHITHTAGAPTRAVLQVRGETVTKEKASAAT